MSAEIVVAAHPDDEVIGAGARLAATPGAVVVHVTDGAPRDLADAQALGFASRDDYAAARRREGEAALGLAGIDGDRIIELGVVDQEGARELPAIARALEEILRARRAAVVLTHAYEGGHPDHDATALAVHAACALLGNGAPALWEMTGYHLDAQTGAVVRGAFLPAPEAGPELVHAVVGRGAALKEQMYAAFATQARVLAEFPRGLERFRRAPRYRFTRPPHEGLLHYERFSWGITGAEFCERARVALAALGLRPDEAL